MGSAICPGAGGLEVHKSRLSGLAGVIYSAIASASVPALASPDGRYPLSQRNPFFPKLF